MYYLIAGYCNRPDVEVGHWHDREPAEQKKREIEENESSLIHTAELRIQYSPLVRAVRGWNLRSHGLMKRRTGKERRRS